MSDADAFEMLRVLAMTWDVKITSRYSIDGAIFTVRITNPEFRTRPACFTYTGLDLARQITRAYNGESGDS